MFNKININRYILWLWKFRTWHALNCTVFDSFIVLLFFSWSNWTARRWDEMGLAFSPTPFSVLPLCAPEKQTKKHHYWCRSITCAWLRWDRNCNRRSWNFLQEYVVKSLSAQVMDLQLDPNLGSVIAHGNWASYLPSAS